MQIVFLLLIVQIVLGGLDNLLNHELTAHLPGRSSARRELGLHAAREAIYAIVFLGLAHLEWRGGWAAILALLLLCEFGITLADFIEEDRTRALSPFERALHTVMTICYGCFLATLMPILLAWASKPTTLASQAYPVFSPLLTVAALGVGAWSLRNFMALSDLQDNEFDFAEVPTHKKRGWILITGATGFVGSALTRSLLVSGHPVVILTRDTRQARLQFANCAWVVDSLDDIPPETRLVAIIHLAGAAVIGPPWTGARRTHLIDSRVRILNALHALARRLDERPYLLVAASAVGYYGVPPGSGIIDESWGPEPKRFQSELCVTVEREARRAETLGMRVIRLRLGLVLGKGGGIFPQLAFAARKGLATILGAGKQPFPWIHLDDVIGLIRLCMNDPSISGPVNAVAPEPVSQASVCRELAAAYRMPAWLKLPALPLKLLLGEMSELLLTGQSVAPVKALAAGYRFRFPTLGSAFRDLVSSERGDASILERGR